MQTHATTNDAMTPLRYQYRHVGHMRCLTRTIRQPSNEHAPDNNAVPENPTHPERKTRFISIQQPQHADEHHGLQHVPRPIQLPTNNRTGNSIRTIPRHQPSLIKNRFVRQPYSQQYGQQAGYHTYRHSSCATQAASATPAPGAMYRESLSHTLIDVHRQARPFVTFMLS